MTDLKNLREERNMTQEQLAEVMGVGQSTIAHWESGYRKPDIVMLKKLANVLKCTTDQLLNFIDIEKE